MKKLAFPTLILSSLLIAGTAMAGQALVSDHAVGTAIAKPNVNVAGLFGTDIAVDNNSNYTITATVEGVQIVIEPHRGKILHFSDDIPMLYVDLTYSDGCYIWNTSLVTPESTALQVSAPYIVDGNPYFQVDAFYN